MINDPNITFEKLIGIREAMKAEIRTDQFVKVKNNIKKILIDLESENGITVSSDEIETYADGTLLGYKGVQAILYISDTGKNKDYLMDDELLRSSNRRGGNPYEEKSPKFHFSWCRTLDEMKRKGRYDRYVLLRNKDNRFKVQARDDRYGESYFLDQTVKLFACKNCLEGNLGHTHSIGYKGYNKNWSVDKKIDAVRDFNIKEFLDENETIFNTIRYETKYNSNNVPINNYSTDFPEISRRIRASKNWTCSSCGIYMIDMKKGLHTHHRNGNKFDNRETNLEVICAKCHQKYHPNMHIDSEVERFIKKHLEITN